MSKCTIILDSSQISNFLECPMMWYYKNYIHLEPNFITQQSVEPMNAGSYGHHLLDIYYAQRRRGLSLNDAAATAFQYDPDKETCQCGCNYRDHKRIELLNIEECRSEERRVGKECRSRWS